MFKLFLHELQKQKIRASLFIKHLRETPLPPNFSVSIYLSLIWSFFIYSVLCMCANMCVKANLDIFPLFHSLGNVSFHFDITPFTGTVICIL